ncbi:MAG: hypothetical protein Q4B54_13755, partial [Coriobacteriales bacterium]|nr:hypothetical protein [Coriobacteriales bacterium]
MAEKRTRKRSSESTHARKERPQARRRPQQRRRASQGSARQNPRRQRARQGQHAQPRRRRRGITLPVLVISGVALVLVVVTSIFACTRMAAGGKAANQEAGQAAEQGSADQAANHDATANKGAASVSFCAVGDNLINEGGDY